MTPLEATVEIVKSAMTIGNASTGNLSHHITDEINRKEFIKGIEEIYKKIEELYKSSLPTVSM